MHNFELGIHKQFVQLVAEHIIQFLLSLSLRLSVLCPGAGHFSVSLQIIFFSVFTPISRQEGFLLYESCGFIFSWCGEKQSFENVNVLYW